ncbi:hypothetical protein ACQKND_22510 [Viridibacillus arvi]
MMSKRAELEEFNKDVYTNCSENNMPHITEVAKLSEQEQEMVEDLFKVAL